MKKEALLYEKGEAKKVRCGLCAHRCVIADGYRGRCAVRQNAGGVLYSLVYGKAIALHVDPIEKKPLYHFFPGSGAFSIATAGCNFACDFCQNWQISQSPRKNAGAIPGHDVPPEAVVRQAKERECRSISYTYTEPTVFFEYAYETARLAREAGLCNTFVTNGFMSAAALETIHPYLDAANVDLKSFRDEFYHTFCKARLEPVLDSIRLMKDLGIWVEVTTLVIPGRNDSDEELADIARFIASLGEEIPWHISRYHPDYRYHDSPATPLETLRRARAIGNEAGLRYVYLGNVLEGNATQCPACKKTVIDRAYFDITVYAITEGRCIHCGAVIDGRF
ncbi:MAG: AmmeMemoRadiSam system radical SAM enzyme [Candidatus Omnitrophica bacterium]|nr:AmmeMemoRadiSam system radical SAM enzyme [Candidatus Omnitrophota bacterium]